MLRDVKICTCYIKDKILLTGRQQAHTAHIGYTQAHVHTAHAHINTLRHALSPPPSPPHALAPPPSNPRNPL